MWLAVCVSGTVAKLYALSQVVFLAAACSRSPAPVMTPETAPAAEPPLSPPPVLNVPAEPQACTGKSCGEPCTVCASEVDPCIWHGGQCDADGDCVMASTNLVCPMARAPVPERQGHAP